MHWNLETLSSNFVSAMFIVQLQADDLTLQGSYHIEQECQFCNFKPKENSNYHINAN